MQPRQPRIYRLLAPLLVLMLIFTACNQGMPGQSGEYPLKEKSLSYDGSQYEFAWIDRDGSVKWARGDDVRLVQDERTFLEMKDGKPVVHLTSEEPVAVHGRDGNGDFTSFWFPFVLGTMVGGRDRTVIINEPYPGTSRVPPTTPTYRYPPTDSFGRGDTIQGSVSNNRPSSPDYKRIQPIPDAISGQSGGSGSGSAATNRTPSYSSGQTGGSGTGSAATSKATDGASGQVGGVGTGSAATSKGTFRSGGDANVTSPSTSSGGSSGTTKGKAPSVTSPSGGKSSGGITGGKSSGGFSGGKSSGVRIGGRR